MRAVWSFWSRPFREHRRSSWHSDRAFLCAWVLSVETARRHHPETHLYTDRAGARLLVEGLGLPFTSCTIALDVLDGSAPGWWALGKIHTYGMQPAPFVHIDHDVFLWKPLPQRMRSAGVIAQNSEAIGPAASHYRPGLVEELLTKGRSGWLPKEWTWYRSIADPERAVSCGIFGGRDLGFIHGFASQALRLATDRQNRRAWRLFAGRGSADLLVEQYFLAACAEYHRTPIEYLFRSAAEAERPEAAARAGYTHLLGDAKRDPGIAARLERRVARDYPEQYERCVRLAARPMV